MHADSRPLPPSPSCASSPLHRPAPVLTAHPVAIGHQRFEKSLLDLIRGLRYHKGNEKEYIQRCLKECRSEVRSQDMDVKATALLKLVYLEMVGHDMSWASFHVLEVMSSQKLHQKRIGYLAAVQSFRTDTEVLMLATNLLKKDLSTTSPITIQLPIAALPHVITPSLAMSVLSDLLPRLNHSHRVIRKKTIVTLYRMALVYPETLRAAWPKIKDRLMDPTEDPSVTAAIVNVICELGWRRPHDFLPLAPRLFELLVDGGNNWMAIKLIKLFATLTPLEPRLVRKLLPPLTDMIRTTPAMSLLYECINGIIQGGILGSDDDISGRDEIASLCVTKLRSMITIQDDANLKYVALLAFNKIVATHPFLVSQQEDVIMECIDSPDISIRIKALDLVQGMVSSDNLMSIVGRLMRQLKQSAAAEPQKLKKVQQLEFRADPALYDDGEDDNDEPDGTEGAEGPAKTAKSQQPPLPEDYRIDVIQRILSMCSQNNYGNMSDFDWYIDILTQLLRTVPQSASDGSEDSSADSSALAPADVSERVGNELRNVAVKVRAMRGAAVRAASDVLSQLSVATAGNRGASVTALSLRPVAWMAGEYAELLPSTTDTLSVMLHLLPRIRPAEVVATCVQAVGKLFAAVVSDSGSAYGDEYGMQQSWTAERRSSVALLIARLVHALEPLGEHPSLEVQERAVEFSELLKLADEAVAAAPALIDGVQQDPPLLLTEAIPSLFSGWELNSVAQTAQLNVPLPSGLDLDEPIHANLSALLAAADADAEAGAGGDSGVLDDGYEAFDVYYYQRPAQTSISSAEPSQHQPLQPAISRLQQQHDDRSAPASYQQHDTGEEAYLDADILARRRAEREERNRDDPYYIPSGNGRATAIKAANERTSTPIHDILTRENGQELDIDSIPVMQLDLRALGAGGGGGGDGHVEATRPRGHTSAPSGSKPRTRPQIVVAVDETLSGSGRSTPRSLGSDASGDSRSQQLQQQLQRKKTKQQQQQQQSLLQVDSSYIGALSLEDKEGEDRMAGNGHRSGGPSVSPAFSGSRAVLDYERQKRADAEMAQALREVEKRRLEMQRANERVQVAQGVPTEGVAVVRKKKKKTKKTEDATAKKKKKPAQSALEGEAGAGEGEEAERVPEVAAVAKKKKKVPEESVVVGGEGPRETAPEASVRGPAEAVVVKKKTKKKVRQVDLGSEATVA